VAVPDGGAPASLVETHSAVVFFVGDRAYKLKKPVDLGFLDFRTLEARRAVCHREVELNRRLAPDVYLGVADVLDVDGAVCDHLVVMRRMPTELRLSSLVMQGAPVDDHLWHLAHLLAAFHARSARLAAADLAAGIPATRARWRANTTEMLAMPVLGPSVTVVRRIQALADRYLDGRAALFEERVAHGRAVDGHGDLLADDVFCLDDGPRVLDCIEFDDRLRLGDGLADAAFLAMDLERIGRPESAERFLAAYQEHAGDTWPASLAHHHVAYRAQVRAKVGAIRAAQGDEHAPDEVRALLDLVTSHLEAGRVRLILVGGLPGTGKSRLAAGLGEELVATVLRSDEIRKEQAGLAVDAPAGAPFGAGLYTEASTTATYETVLDRARVALGRGETVIVDASWISADWRTRARALAGDVSADLVELRCDAPPEVAAQRLTKRLTRGGDPSDATPEIAAAMAAIDAPWPEATTVTTTRSKPEALADALAVVRAPARL
jgi:aminoglycoside phosphotransferase family enzyme/predicted kinase